MTTRSRTCGGHGRLTCTPSRSRPTAGKRLGSWRRRRTLRAGWTAPPEWLRPTYKQLQALIAFRVAGWDKMTRVEANIAIAHAIHRRQCGLADYGLVRELVAAGISPPERALGLTDTQARRAQLRHILPAAVLAKVRTTLFTTN